VERHAGYRALYMQARCGERPPLAPLQHMVKHTAMTYAPSCPTYYRRLVLRRFCTWDAARHMANTRSFMSPVLNRHGTDALAISSFPHYAHHAATPRSSAMRARAAISWHRMAARGDMPRSSPLLLPSAPAKRAPYAHTPYYCHSCWRVHLSLPSISRGGCNRRHQRWRTLDFSAAAADNAAEPCATF